MAKSALKSLGKDTAAIWLLIGLLLGYGLSYILGANAAKPGAGSSSISIKAGSELKLGGRVSFNTNAVGLAGWEYPMVAISCFQNQKLVYVDLIKPADSSLLGGSASEWKTNGGAATCIADLDAYGWKGGKESVRVLASVSFDAAAQ